MLQNEEKRKELENYLENSWIEVIKAHIEEAGNDGILANLMKSKVTRGKKKTLNYITTRLEFAKSGKDVSDVIQKFCRQLNLKLPEHCEYDIDILRENEKEAMKVLRKNTKIIVLKSAFGTYLDPRGMETFAQRQEKKNLKNNEKEQEIQKQKLLDF